MYKKEIRLVRKSPEIFIAILTKSVAQLTCSTTSQARQLEYFLSNNLIFYLPTHFSIPINRHIILLYICTLNYEKKLLIYYDIFQ